MGNFLGIFLLVGGRVSSVRLNMIMSFIIDNERRTCLPLLLLLPLRRPAL